MKNIENFQKIQLKEKLRILDTYTKVYIEVLEILKCFSVDRKQEISEN